ncbi:MAG: hypothetical protein II938_00035 [Alphaproteobacteria bacterium]|nr:hypothetical protein [Alphaproteobacteria bacterium]
MKKKLWRLSKKTTVWLYRFFEAIVAFILVIFGLAFWKLYTEPMDAKFMLPTLEEQLLPKNSGYHLNVDSAILSAGFKEDGLFHLDMKGLQLIRPDQTVAINLPTVNLSYGFWHIVTLNYMPNKLTIEHPDVRVVIDEEGQWRFLDEKESTDDDIKKIKPISMRTLLRHALSFYDISVTDGVMIVEDLAMKQKLSLPQFDLHLHRRYGGLRHMARFSAVAKMDDHLTDIKAQAMYGRITKNLKIEAGITPLYLSPLGRFIPVLDGIDLPVAVSLVADFNLRKKYKIFAECLEKMKFQVKALSEGVLNLPSPIKASYDVKSAEINGAASAGFKTIKIAESKLELANNIDGNIEVVLKGLPQFLEDQKVENLQTILTAKVQNVPMSDVPKVWPQEQGTSAHEWVKKHLSQGRVYEADFKLTFNGSELTDVFGDVRVEGARVDYLPQMPAIENASAQVLLYPDKVEIIADKGQANKIKLMNAHLLFNPLGEETTFLDILLDLDGPISEMLLAINKKPLKLLENVDFDWNKIKGNAETRVHLNFPLVEERLVPELKVDVTATGENIGIALDTPKLEIKDGKAELFVDRVGLKLEGKVGFKDQPMAFVWTEDFTPTSGTTATYNVSGVVDAVSLNELVPDIEQYISGMVPFKVDLTRKAPDRLWQGMAEFDLTDSKAMLYPFGLTKEKANQALLKVKLDKGTPDFSEGVGGVELDGKINGEKLHFTGNATWGSEWMISLDDVQMPGNSFSGRIEQKEKTLSLLIKGDSWDLSELKNMPLLKKESVDKENKTILPPNIKFENSLTRLILNKEKPMENVILNGERKDNIWKYFHAEAVAKEPFVIVFDPDKKRFEGEFGDLGALLSYAGVSDRFSGGKLRLDSEQDSTGLIKGKIKVDNTELNETGFMLQAVSILGIVDAIRGKNIVFDEIHIPFEFAPEGEFKLRDAYAASSNIGVTFRGIINLDALDLEGDVIPAYAVNSLPGKIPLIGALFREGEGGGLIGVKYSVTGRPTNPNVEFHPLSSIAPGALGYIF